MTRVKFIIMSYVLLAVSIYAMDSAPNVKLVILGKTGIGKSTAVIAFYNYAQGLTWDAYPKYFPMPTPFQPCNVAEYAERQTEDHTHGQLQAVTQRPSEYTARSDNLTLTMIDCPGVADPRGVDKDRKIIDDAACFLSETAEFNALCIVLPGNLARATVEEKYAIEQIKTLIPRAVINRVFIIITHTSVVSENIRQFLISFGLPTGHIFAFDNIGMSQEGYRDFTGIEFDCPKERDVSVEDESKRELAIDVRRAWLRSTEEFSRLILAAQGLGKYGTGEMTRISEIKRSTSAKIVAALSLISEINEAVQRLDLTRVAHTQFLREHEHASSAADSAKKALSLAQMEKKIADALCAYESYPEKVTVCTSYFNLNCLNCGFTCRSNIPGGSYEECSCCKLRRYACFNGSYCSNCPSRCSLDFHRDERYYFETVNRKREIHAVKSRQSSAATAFTTCSNELATKQRLLAIKTRERDEKRLALEHLTAIVSGLQQQKDALQVQIIELYIEAEAVSMNSISLHIGEYYDVRIRATIDPLERAKLLNDKQLYIEQVELYKQMKAGLQ